jgi:hypothetical protein
MLCYYSCVQHLELRVLFCQLVLSCVSPWLLVAAGKRALILLLWGPIQLALILPSFALFSPSMAALATESVHTSTTCSLISRFLQLGPESDVAPTVFALPSPSEKRSSATFRVVTMPSSTLLSFSFAFGKHQNPSKSSLGCNGFSTMGALVVANSQGMHSTSAFLFSLCTPP